MEIIQNDGEIRGDFSAFIDGKKAGMITYTWAGTDKFIIDHTEVESEFNGKGVGKQLIFSAVDFARSRNLTIIPLCPFAAATFKKYPEIQDVTK